MSNLRIVVIGGGVIGLASAWELAARGHAVRVFDKGPIGQGASRAAGGIVSPLRPWQAHTVVDRLAASSRALYGDFVKRLIDQSGVDPQYRQSGMVVVGDTHKHAAQEWALNTGRDLKWLDRAGLTKLVPDIGRVREGVYLDDIYQVRNPLLITALERACIKLGVELRPNEAVDTLLKQGLNVTGVRTKNAEICADLVVIAAGAWSDGLCSALHARLNVTPVRGQMIWYQDSPERAGRPIVDDGEHYIVTRRDGVTLVGSTVENVGFDQGITDKALIRLKNKAKNLIPGLGELTPLGQWSGLRPGRAHGIPLIGAYPGLDGLFLNTGHFRNGITLAPASVQMLADRVEGVSDAEMGVSSL
ncbi:MAG: glycine oxidase ThiO [Pseudomonadota bacterium]